MTTEAEEIRVERLYVYWQVGNALCRVEQNFCTYGMGLRDHVLGGIDGAQHVGHVGEGYQFGVLLQQLFVYVETQQAIGGGREQTPGGPGALGRAAPEGGVWLMRLRRRCGRGPRREI